MIPVCMEVGAFQLDDRCWEMWLESDNQGSERPHFSFWAIIDHYSLVAVIEPIHYPPDGGPFKSISLQLWKNMDLWIPSYVCLSIVPLSPKVSSFILGVGVLCWVPCTWSPPPEGIWYLWFMFMFLLVHSIWVIFIFVNIFLFLALSTFVCNST